MSDALVKSAIGHWGPRFVSNGVALADFEDVTGAIAGWQDWCSAWSARAADHEAMGRDALASGLFLSAGEHLQRAGVYYHFGKFLFVHDLPQMRAAHERAVACRRDALAHLVPAGERIEIPFEGTRIAAILRKPVGIERPPLMLMACGLDSCKEETAAYEEPFLARGIAICVFDGPGQGEAEYDLPIRGDYEIAVSAIIDHLARRPDIDATRLGMWGVSLGGYYAPRAAAFDSRIRACIALSGPYDWSEAWPNLPAITRDAFRVRSHSRNEDEALAVGRTLSLRGAAERIRCPLFVVAGKKDTVVPWRQAERLAKEARGPVTFLAIEDGNHVANNRTYRWRLQTADWMAEQLAR